MVMMDAERIFVDTNVLLAATDRSRQTHESSVEFLQEGVRGSYRLFTCGQVFREYLVVATRPLEENGMGLSPVKAWENIATFRKVIQVLDETHDSLVRLGKMVKDHQLKGKRIHDANLVAVMHTHGLVHLKTWNPKDFAPFSEVLLV
jgi:predicted nucleic acid-binding protein